MIFNKTGVLRTTKQISSRIFRLSKAGKLLKDSNNKTPQTVGSSNEEVDDLMLTPLEDLINVQGSMDSSKHNAVIDNELDVLLASSPLEEVFENMSYRLSVRNFKMSFKNAQENHTFTNLVSINVTKSITIPIEAKVREKLRRMNVPTWLITHDMNINCNHVATSTPRSAISPTASQIHIHQPPHQMQLQHMNLTKGIFQSYMIVDVSCEERSQSMLNWRNSLTVYKRVKNYLMS